MNCCDYECNQSTNCPARGAKVAAIGARMPGPEPLPPGGMDRYLMPIAKWALAMMVALALGATSLVLVL